jgi:MFS family permease
MRRLITSHALAGTAVALPWPALLAAVWQTTDDPTLLGLAGAARFAPCVLLSAVLGGIGDRFGRFRTVRVVTALRLACLALMAAFLYAGLTWAAVAAATLTVAAGVPAFPSLAALVPQVADDAERATDTLVTWEISAFVIGPALGGLLLGFGGPASGFASVLLIAAALIVLPRRVAGEPQPDEGRLRLLRGLREVLAVPLVRRAVASVMALNAVIGLLGVTLLSLAMGPWQAGVTEYGWATAVHGFASLAAPALILALRRLGAALAAQLVVVVPLVAVALAPTWTIALAPLLLLGAGLTMVECRTTRMLQLGAPPRYLALALGLADAALIAAAMLAAMVAPALIEAVGPQVLLMVIAGLGAVVLGWGLRSRSAGRGVTDDGGLEVETQPAVEGDGRRPVVLNGQVDVALR